MDGSGFSLAITLVRGTATHVAAAIAAVRELEVRRQFAIALTLACGLPALFLHSHPYFGIYHDAFLYSLQALKHLDPAALGGDLFFRYGSQDDLTVFSPLYAAAISWLGLDAAAHLLARASVVALSACALLLSRRLMDRDLAWLALALFIVVPGRYGARDIFAYGEDFVTPRGLTEALVLASLALLIDGRRIAALVAILFGLLLHPLMALPGVLAGTLLIASNPLRMRLGAAGLATAAATVLIAALAPMGRLTFVDPLWRHVLEEQLPYLLTDQWWLLDWQRCLVPLATLGCAVIALPAGTSRRLASAALIVGAGGLALAVAASSITPVALFIQGQPWRWLWIARAVATLMLAPLAVTLWGRGMAGRGIAALLVLAWLGSEESIGLPAALLAVLAVLFDARGGDRARYAVWIAWLPVVPLVWLVLQVTSQAPIAALVLATIIVWNVAFRSGSTTLRTLAILGAATCLGTQVKASVGTEIAPGFDEQTYRALAPWRERIRPDQTVLFPRSPQMVWLVLHRRQIGAFSGAVFSRELALASEERWQRLTNDLGGSSQRIPDPRRPGFTREFHLTMPLFRHVCRNLEIDFVVTDDTLPMRGLTSYAPGPFDGFHLYACADADAGRAEPG